jgi:uncharacterized membrane protein
LIPLLVVWLHVLVVFLLVAGILGRDVVYERAARASDLAEIRALVSLGGVFERRFVRPATTYVPLAGILAAWLRGWPILGFLQGGQANWVLAAIVIYLTIIPVIVLVLVPRGRIFRRAYDEAVARGAVTPELTRALRDPWVRAARVYEWVMIAVISCLMILKPF